MTKGNLTRSGTFGFPNLPPHNVRGLRPLTIPRFDSISLSRQLIKKILQLKTPAGGVTKGNRTLMAGATSQCSTIELWSPIYGR